MDIIKIYNNDSAKRKYYKLRDDVLAGKHIPYELIHDRIDGRPRTIVRSGHIMLSAISIYSGFALSYSPSYVSLYKSEQNDLALDALDQLYVDQSIALCDFQHFSHAMIYGSSIEYINYQDGEIKFRAEDPRNWVIIRDQYDSIKMAIKKVTYEKNTYLDGEVLEKEKTEYHAYTDDTYDIYDDKGVLLSSTPNPMGEIPIIVFQLTKDALSLFDDSFFELCKQHEIVTSALIDHTKYAISTKLAVEGLDYTMLLDRNQNGLAVIQVLNELGIFPVPSGGSAQFLTRQIETEHFRMALNTIRENIYRLLSLPDLTEKVTGSVALNSISGVALRLLFLPMDYKCSEFEKYFILGLKNRVEKINRYWSLTGGPNLINYSIKLNRNFPQNVIETYNSAKSLVDILAVKDIIKLLPGIDNPELAYYNLLEEKKEEFLQVPENNKTVTQNTSEDLL
jgi:SPP1 family phage portal protein